MMANRTRGLRDPFEPHKTARRQIRIRRGPSYYTVIIEPIPTERPSLRIRLRQIQR